jgi:hypothetical protein
MLQGTGISPVPSPDIRAIFDQQLGDLLMAIPAGVMEWRPTILSGDRAGACRASV